MEDDEWADPPEMNLKLDYVTPDIVYYWLCPKCDQSCLAPYNPNSLDWRVECSDCCTVYEVRPTPPSG